MTTKIITEQSAWIPVKIEIEFETRDQLATFCMLYADPFGLARLFSKDELERWKVSRGSFENAMHLTVDHSVWSKLRDIVDHPTKIS